MCTFTLHEQHCRHCEKLISSEKLDVQGCQAKLQELIAVRKRIANLVPRNQASPAQPATPQNQHAQQNPTILSMPLFSHAREFAEQLQGLVSSPFGFAKAQPPPPSGSGAFSSPAPSTNGLTHTTSFPPAQHMSAPATPNEFHQPAGPFQFSTPQTSPTKAKRKSDALDPFLTAPKTTPPSAKRHLTKFGQSGRGSAPPNPQTTMAIPPNYPPVNQPWPLSSPQVQARGQNEDMMEIDGENDVEMTNSDFGSSSSSTSRSQSTVDFEGDIELSDPVYEEPNDDDDDDRSEEMELECIPRQVGILGPDWGVCEACARARAVKV